MTKDNAALRRPVSQQVTYAQIVAERAIAALKAVPEWKDNRTELMHVLDLGRLFLNTCHGLTCSPAEQKAFLELYEKCAACGRTDDRSARLAEFHDRKTNALILDVLYELQSDVRELRKALTTPKRRKTLTLPSAAERQVAA